MECYNKEETLKSVPFEVDYVDEKGRVFKRNEGALAHWKENTV